VTFPTLIVAGLTLNCPAVAVVLADPLNAMVKLASEASDVIVTLPLKLPADCGAKVTLKDAVCPGIKVKGVLNPEILNPVPVVATAEMSAFEAPVLLRITDWVWLVPV
jgi:hypothetical protein